MHKNNILFFEEDIRCNIKDTLKVKKWIFQCIIDEGKKLKHLNIIFTSDDYLNNMNINHLNHDTFTDIITFNNSDNKLTIEGDLYISIERVQENARCYCVDFYDELYRVIVHGVLHLIGYDDKNENDKKIMREKEREYLNIL